MPKLNQIIAVEKGTKQRAFEKLSLAHHALSKQSLLSGLSRTYQPRDDEGEKYPDESTKLQANASDIIDETVDILAELFDVVATKEYANGDAKADIVVNGKTLLTGVPVTYLLFLEKQLVDLHTFISKLPVLDPSDNWHWDDAANAHVNDPAETVRTKKVPRSFIKAEATDKHAAQVELYYEDIPVGNWRTVKFSGALPAAKVVDLTRRVEDLQAAVKFAREDANGIDVDAVKVGEVLLDFLFY